MSESSLSLGYPDFAAAVGRFMGFGGTSGAWSSDETDIIDDIVQSGVRRFYFPAPTPEAPSGYRWSFVFIDATQALIAADYDYDAPDSFGGMVSPFTFATADTGYFALTKVSEAQIRVWQQSGGASTSGPPRYFAVRPRDSGGTTGQRHEFLFWPTPDGVYTLQYTHMALISKISTGAPYPLGGMAHCETILESCLAVAEERHDGEKGIHAAAYVERLAASIALDINTQGVDSFGIAGDGGEVRMFRHFAANSITVDGVTPS